MCAAMARHGADLLADLPAGAGILTHCNTGALVSGSGDGTALAVIFELARRGKRPHVWADETRPLLQGARLTMWELMQRGIDCHAHLRFGRRPGDARRPRAGRDHRGRPHRRQRRHGQQDRHVQRGDARAAHGIPFYVAAPATTFDLSIATGAEIPIEQRAAEEITSGFGANGAGSAAVYNPAFDVTPAELIAAIITDVVCPASGLQTCEPIRLMNTRIRRFKLAQQLANRSVILPSASWCLALA